jgi:hypothetical protein
LNPWTEPPDSPFKISETGVFERHDEATDSGGMGGAFPVLLRII